MEIDKKTQGKKNRESGARFERKVRADLESKEWIVARWTNNVEEVSVMGVKTHVLRPAKSNYYNLRTTGFPDYIAFTILKTMSAPWGNGRITQKIGEREVIGVECKSNGYLDKIEKTKCQWLLDKNIFSKILIASKSKQRGKIEYFEFKND